MSKALEFIAAARFGVVGGICLLLFFPANAPAEGVDWFRWRGPDLNGISPEKNWSVNWPAEGPGTLWRASVGTGFSSVSVRDGRVYTMGNSEDIDTVFCFDSATGQRIWSHSYPSDLGALYYEGGPGSTPAVDEDRVYTLSKHGDLFCFDAATGRVIWNKNVARETESQVPRWGFAGSPLVQDSLLVLNMGSHGIALEKETGRIIWSSGKEAAGYAAPVPVKIEGRGGVFIFAADALVAVDLATGEPWWRQDWETKWDINAADPIVHENQVFISSHDRGGAVFEFDLEGARLLWRSGDMGNHFNSAVLLDGHLYGIDGNTDQPPADLRCLDWETGEVRWSYRGLGLGSLMAADGKLIVLGEKGQLVVAEATPAAFRRLAHAHLLGGKCWTVPVLSQGKIYCRNAAGTLLCLDVGQE